jgi:carbon storage regulator CsrA
MLVLTRKQTEQLLIGHDITVTVLSVQGNRVRIGIEAPGDVRVLRGELASWTGSVNAGNAPSFETSLAAVGVH